MVVPVLGYSRGDRLTLAEGRASEEGLREPGNVLGEDLLARSDHLLRHGYQFCASITSV